MGDYLTKKEKIDQWKQKISDLRDELENYSLSPEVICKFNELESLLDEENLMDLKGGGVAAQVSIYPLRVASLSPIIDNTLLIFNKFDLEVRPGSMSTLISGDNDVLWSALNQAFVQAAVKSEVVMVITVSNACPLPPNVKTKP